MMTFGSTPGSDRLTRRVVTGTAGGAIAIGLVVIAGWTIDMTAMKSVLPDSIAMQPITALAMLLSGVSLLFAGRRGGPRAITFGLPAVVMALALLTLAQYLSGADFGIDTFVFADAILEQSFTMAHPGRMAEATAASFALVASALLLADAKGPVKGIFFSASASAVLFVALLTLLGYLFEAAPIPAIFGFTHLALPTGIGLGALSIGLLALRPDVGWASLLRGDSVGASAARRLLPVAIIVPIVAAWLAFQGSEAGLYPAEIRLALLTGVSVGLLGGFTIWAATRLDKLDAIGRAERALRESEERLAQSQAELLHVARVSEQGVMGLTLAHELNQPLAAASNYVAAAQRLVSQKSGISWREPKKALEHAQGSINRAGDIIRGLRAFVTTGRVESKPHDLHKIISDAFILALAGRVLRGAATDFQFDPTARWVKVDPIQIQQVIINLVRNAVEAMEGMETREIIVSTRRAESGMAEIAVADSGPGFPDAAPADLFSPFTSLKGTGMGLGLSISRTIVEAHGGRIWAENAARGAVFRFTLPISVAPSEEPDAISLQDL